MTNDESIGFSLTLNDGTQGRVVIVDEGNGLCLLTCLNAFENFVPLDELQWSKSLNAHNLLADTTNGDGVYYGMAAQEINPQSIDELREALGLFVTRLGMATEAFRTTLATPTASSPR